ncbi:MAG: M28 family peptidase [Gemmatimonadales bacterium]
MRPLIAAVLTLTACSQEPPPPREFDGAAAFRYAAIQLGFGPRIPGSPGHRQMGTWLDSLLRQGADTVIVQRWTHLTRNGDSLPLANFLARWNPAAQTRLLFVAHWDTRPRADAYGSRDTSAAVPGANDGASGVAVLLGMADALKKNPPAPGIGVDLLFVDGEDYGDFSRDEDVLLGSRYYAANQPPGPAPRIAVVFDMVGAKDMKFRPEGYSQTAAADVVDLVWETARRIGHGGVFVDDGQGPTVTDDHIPLQQAGIRAIDIIGYPWQWHHTADDTIDKISAESLQAVGDVGMALVRRKW